MTFFISVLLAIAATLATFLLYKLSINKANNAKSMAIHEPPEPSNSFPIIGHLHLLFGATLPHRILSELADQHGPVFTLRFGRSHRTLVVSSIGLARECFTTNDRAFANRPSSLITKIMAYDDALQYSSAWREMRKIITLGLFSASKLDHLKRVTASEVHKCIREIFDMWVENGQNPVRIDMKQLFEKLMFSITMQMVAGKSYFGLKVSEVDVEVARRFRQLLDEFNALVSISGLYSFFPFLAWVDFHGHVRDMKRVAKEMDVIIDKWVAEHGQKNDTSKDCRHFIDLLRSTFGEGGSPTVGDSHTAIKATILAIQLGTDTAHSAMEWALALLMKNSHKLEKLQAELDSHVGKDRVVDESDVANLEYLQAVVKETLRLYPPGPLLLPHVAREDCQVGGFHVTRGTQLLVNAWKIHRDPHVWLDPEEFHPERFCVSTHQNMEIIPFGLGCRSCPANVFVPRAIQLVIARLLHSFELVVPPDAKVELEEGFRAVLFKQNPLQVLLKPRLPSELY